jgi:hypothetical protein
MIAFHPKTHRPSLGRKSEAPVIDPQKQRKIGVQGHLARLEERKHAKADWPRRCKRWSAAGTGQQRSKSASKLAASHRSALAANTG